jgi:hypothetical protein
VLGGVGVAGVGAAVASGLVLVNTRKTVDSNCSADKICTQAGLDAASTGKKMLVVNTVGWVVGALGLGFGTYFVLSAPKSSSTAALTTQIGLDGASISYVRSF